MAKLITRAHSSDQGPVVILTEEPIDYCHYIYHVLSFCLTLFFQSLYALYAATGKDYYWHTAILIQPMCVLSFMIAFLLQPKRNDKFYRFVLYAHFFQFAVLSEVTSSVASWLTGWKGEIDQYAMSEAKRKSCRDKTIIIALSNSLRSPPDVVLYNMLTDHPLLVASLLTVSSMLGILRIGFIYIPIMYFGFNIRQILAAAPKKQLSNYLTVTLLRNGAATAMTMVFFAVETFSCIVEMHDYEGDTGLLVDTGTCIKSAYVGMFLSIFLLIYFLHDMAAKAMPISIQASFAIPLTTVANFSLKKRHKFQFLLMLSTFVSALFLFSFLGVPGEAK